LIAFFKVLGTLPLLIVTELAAYIAISRWCFVNKDSLGYDDGGRYCSIPNTLDYINNHGEIFSQVMFIGAFLVWCMLAYCIAKNDDK
jgi:hypothetical protein